MRYEKLPTLNIELDKSNPRIAQYIRMYPNVTQDQLYLALGFAEPGSVTDSGPSFTSLKEAIRTHRGLIHPILVNKKSDSKYLVIEGNTRLAIYRDFLKNKVDGDWTQIPCIVYDDLNEAMVDAIRLQAHLVGVRQWDPYSKAKYLSNLRNCQHLTWNQIIDYCGGKKTEAEAFISAYSDMELYYRPILDDDGSFDPKKFSAFVELQKSNIKQSIVMAGYTLKDFSKWVNDGLFKRLENVRRLPAILANKKAKDLFLSNGDRAAIALLDSALVHGDYSNLNMETLAKLLAEKLRKISLEEITKYKENISMPEVIALQDTQEELKSLFELIIKEE